MTTATKKERDIVAASDLMGQVTSRSAKMTALTKDGWRLKATLDMFLIRYSISEDTIAESQLREESGLDGRSFGRAVKELTDNYLFSRTTNGLKGRAARTTWSYLSDEDAQIRRLRDAFEASPDYRSDAVPD